MRESVLFEVREEHLDTGLRGIPVGHCVTSSVDPNKGLFYVGRPIQELSQKDPTEILYLLYFGEVGTDEQVLHFRQELRQRASLKTETVAAIERLPREGHPMDLLSIALLIAGIYEKTDDYQEDALNLIGKMPHLTALVINHHAGWGKTPSPEPELNYIQDFVRMLQAPIEKKEALIQAMRLFHVLSIDHSGGNLSAFVGKSVASGLEHLYGSVAASMTALAGPRHGRANQDSLAFLESIQKELGKNPSEEALETLLRAKLQNKEIFFGFGHAVLRVEDPRATVCYRFCEEHFPNDPKVQLAQLLRREAVRVLKENPKIQNPYPNIDAITGVMLSAAGFAFPEYFTVLFGFARSIGVAIQIVYERIEAREGKGLPIVRPKYLYKAR